MKNNRKLLKEAIADAKAVKETAIQNAKAALEEAFTPQLKSLLSQRLTEMEEEDENMDETDEYTTPASSKKNKKYVSDLSETDEIDELDELDELDEMDEYKNFNPSPSKKDKQYVSETDEADEADEMDELYETDEADEADEADEVDLEELLAELEELDEDENEADEEEDEGMINEEEEGEEEEGEDDVDIEALLKSPEDLKDFITDIVKDIMGEEGTDVEGEEEEGEEEETEAKPIDEYSLDELLAELKSKKSTAKKVAKKDNKKDKVEEVLGKFIKKISGREGEEERRKELFDKTKKAALDAGLDTPEKWGDRFSKKDKYTSVDDIINSYLDMKDGAKYDSYKGKYRINGGEGNASLTWLKDLTGLEKTASGARAATSINRESLELKGELAEAYSVINTLRSELNEVNLLNAKLLFTNKIFKNRSLTETQKVKVLTAFDKANSVKEAKLVYETLLENLKTTKSSVNESMGFASKAMGTSTKSPIVESNMMVDRFKKLAGII